MDQINFESWTEGLKGEGVIRNILKNNKHNFGQFDLGSICNKTKKKYLYEIKHQERFKGPPFDGHGLPPWQVEFRIKFVEDTGIIPFLVIVEKPSGIVFYQNLIVLHNGEQFVTKKGNRVIYPLTSFKIYNTHNENI